MATPCRDADCEICKSSLGLWPGRANYRPSAGGARARAVRTAAAAAAAMERRAVALLTLRPPPAPAP